jgi:hypothetical protein
VPTRVGDHAPVIRNVVVHMSSEQPLLADIYGLPTSSDAGLVCTNVRSLDGKRPVFIDRIESVFFFPYRAIRFIEIPPEEMQRHLASGGTWPAAAGAAPAITLPAGDLRAADGAGTGDPAGPMERLPVPVPGEDPELEVDEPDGDLEIDEDFLRRIRDI